MHTSTNGTTATKRLINATLRRTLGIEIRRASHLPPRLQKPGRRLTEECDSVSQNQSTPEDITEILHEVDMMLKEANIVVGKESTLELSHHFGLERFREYGAMIIDCINRQYCKKLIIQLPGQRHPYHFHKKKEETFQLLYGDLEIKKEGKWTKLAPGDTMLVKRRECHKFRTVHGAIIEEISTTHYNNDSFYTNKQIARLPRHMRKTPLVNRQKRNVMRDV
jgi:mannose-6-phosphate isomerase-like protein (cupin superfamily)